MCWPRATWATWTWGQGGSQDDAGWVNGSASLQGRGCRARCPRLLVGCVTSKMSGACARDRESNPVLRREVWAQDTAPEIHGEKHAPDTPTFLFCRRQWHSRKRPGLANKSQKLVLIHSCGHWKQVARCCLKMPTFVSGGQPSKSPPRAPMPGWGVSYFVHMNLRGDLGISSKWTWVDAQIRSVPAKASSLWLSPSRSALFLARLDVEFPKEFTVWWEEEVLL